MTGGLTTASILSLQSLEWLGIVGSCAAAAVALLAADARRRSTAMIVALLIAPAVVAGQVWDQDQFADLRSDPGKLALLLAAGFAAVLLIGAAFSRRPVLVPLALVATLSFRVPVEAGGTTVNILLPLYLVIGGAVAALAWRAWRAGPRAVSRPEPGSDPAPAPGSPEYEAERSRRFRPGVGSALRWLLAAALVLYAVQSAWSIDMDNAAKQVAFFFAPFAVMFRLLMDTRWDPRLIVWGFGILAAEALAFSALGFWEYQTRELLWNPKVVSSNQFESFFRVNSVFWDPNIYGRFLALVMITITAAMLWSRSGSRTALAAGALAVLWGGLVLTFSQSSFAALLAGLAVLAALRWSVRWTTAATAVLAIGAIAFVAGFGDTVRLNLGSTKSLDRATSGRVELIEGGLDLALARPITGHGSGSFARAYLRETGGGEREAVSASHTEPVTVAAEQGVIGLVLYAALLVAAIGTLLNGMRVLAPGMRSAPSTGEQETGLRAHVAARAALAAAFGALLFHTFAYAAFLTDPITWAILAVGTALAARAGA